MAFRVLAGAAASDVLAALILAGGAAVLDLLAVALEPEADGFGAALEPLLVVAFEVAALGPLVAVAILLPALGAALELSD
jgi:hypothetical protein